MSEWQTLFDHYEAPPYTLPHTSAAYSFGIAGESEETKMKPAVHWLPASAQGPSHSK